MGEGNSDAPTPNPPRLAAGGTHQFARVELGEGSSGVPNPDPPRLAGGGVPQHATSNIGHRDLPRANRSLVIIMVVDALWSFIHISLDVYSLWNRTERHNPGLLSLLVAIDLYNLERRRMKVIGSLGSVSGLLLRTGQCLLGITLIAVMLLTPGFHGIFAYT